MISEDSSNSRGHVKDASLKSSDLNINNWFGGADNGVGEEFTADHRHGLRVQRLQGVTFQWGMASEIDARLFNYWRICQIHSR